MTLSPHTHTNTMTIIDRMFQYLWFAIAITILILGLRLVGGADEGSRELDPIPAYVTQPGGSDVR